MISSYFIQYWSIYAYCHQPGFRNPPILHQSYTNPPPIGACHDLRQIRSKGHGARFRRHPSAPRRCRAQQLNRRRFHWVFIGISWELDGIQRWFDGILGTFHDFNGDFLGFNEILWDFTGFHGDAMAIPWDLIISWGISRDTNELEGGLRSFMGNQLSRMRKSPTMISGYIWLVGWARHQVIRGSSSQSYGRCFSLPVKWGLLDFMSAVPPPPPPPSPPPPPPHLNCKR